MEPKIEQAISEAAEAIGRADRIGTVGHVAPDADALGSAVAFARSARLAGKEAVASFGDPFVIPAAYEFLPLDVVVPPSDFPEDAEVVVAFDTAVFDRLGSIGHHARKAGTLVVVDHHASNEGFGDIQVIDPQAAAAGQLAYRLIQQLDWPIDEGVATALMAAIVADTGRFQYSSTTPEVLRIGAELMEAGAVPEIVGQNLFEKLPFAYLNLLSAVADRAQLDEAKSLVSAVVLVKDLEEAGVAYEDSDALMDHIRVAREAEVALLIKEVASGFKGSLRSRGAVDVAAIAAEFGGGGHHNASGFSHAGPPEAIVEAVRSCLDG